MTGHKVSIKGYRRNADGKLVKREPRLNASAAIAKAKKPRQRYAKGRAARV